MQWNEEALRQEIKDIKNTTVRFLKNPIEEIGRLPNWEWPKLILFVASFTAICGALAGLVERKFFNIFVGLFFNPIVSLILTGASTIFFALFFKIFANRELGWRQLFTLIVFANLPNFIFSILATYISPIIMVGLAITAFLLFKGLIEIFNLERKLVQRVIVGLYAAFFIYWVAEQVKLTRWTSNFEDSVEAPSVNLGN